MQQKFLQQAHADLPVYLTDVYRDFQKTGTRPFHLRLTLYDGTARSFPLQLPPTDCTEEAAFLAEYIHAFLYYLLSSLGARAVDLYFDPADQALQALVDQRPLVKSYVMDEIYNMMESGEAAVASYYAGDYFTMCDAQAENVDLQFYYPDETNYFIDAMCIPTCCQDQELAECFINFMLSREAAVANAEYIYYASPNRLVYEDPEYIEDMGEDTMDILYPGIGSFRDEYNRSAYRNLDQDTLTFVNSLWETLKIN